MKVSVAHQQEAFFQAVEELDIPRLTQLCRDGFDINKPINDVLPLHAAISYEDLTVLKALLGLGADVHKQSDNMDALNVAIEVGNQQIIELLLKYGADKNRALVVAVACDKREHILFLIAKGADLNARTSAPGEVALHAAALRGSTELCLLLLEEGADLYTTDSKGFTVLHRSVQEGQFALVKLFLNKGMDPSIAIAKDGYDKGETPLHLAVRKGHVAVIEALLEAGADVHARTYRGNTPLWGCIFLSYVGQYKLIEQIVELLIRSGGDINTVNAEGKTSLLAYLSSDYISNPSCSSVSLLIKQGARVDLADNQQCTALHYAVEKRCEFIIAKLLKHGAPLGAKDHEGYTPFERAQQSSIKRDKLVKVFTWHFNEPREQLSKALQSKDFIAAQKLIDSCSILVNLPNKDGLLELVRAASAGNEEVVVFLSNNGAQLNLKEMGNYTALHCAVMNKQRGIVKRLLEAGADPDSSDKNGDTSVQKACELGYESIVGLLIQAGASVNCHNSWGNTPLRAAAMHDHLAIIRQLLLANAEVDATDYQTLATPLMQACKGRNDDTVGLLLEAGASVNLQDRTEYTALHIAAQLNRVKPVRVLLAAGARAAYLSCEGMTPFECYKNDAYTDEVGRIFEQLEDCPVCTKKMNDKAPDDVLRISDSCSHVMHKGCKEQILGSANKQCPVCRTPINIREGK